MELTIAEPRQPRRRFWLKFILFLCFIACLIVGLSSLAALIVLRQGQTASIDNATLPYVDAESIAPELALNQLAGDPTGALALQAANAGELETAGAILAFDNDTPSSAQLALYQLISRKIVDADISDSERRRMVQLLQKRGRALAVLAPDADSTVQAHFLGQGVVDLVSLGLIEDARLTAINLQRLSQQVPTSLPAQRRQMLEPILPHVEELDDPQLAQQIAEQSRNPFLESEGELLPLRLVNYFDSVRNESATINSDALINAIIARQDASRRLADRLRTAIQQDASLRRNQSALQAVANSELALLADALRLEEAARQEHLSTSRSSTEASAEDKLRVLLEHNRWLRLKARIAVLGFGLSIVPEWETETIALGQALTSLNQEISAAVDQVMEGLPEPRQKAALRVEKFLWLALQSEQGFYPDTAVSLLWNDLRFAQDELKIQGLMLALPVLWNASLDVPEFQIQER